MKEHFLKALFYVILILTKLYDFHIGSVTESTLWSVLAVELVGSEVRLKVKACVTRRKCGELATLI
ncbi:unnamed protein product [Arctogadus glacialis]